jgi:hypothetical protein
MSTHFGHKGYYRPMSPTQRIANAEVLVYLRRVGPSTARTIADELYGQGGAVRTRGRHRAYHALVRLEAEGIVGRCPGAGVGAHNRPILYFARELHQLHKVTTRQRADATPGSW